ncbi:MAG: hypothetical protein H6R06_1075 [Proteobacteria bacterium]|jgi:hypothetical protein|nr:hypothetical protein [Pseudomonadota bacterium]
MNKALIAILVLGMAHLAQAAANAPAAAEVAKGRLGRPGSTWPSPAVVSPYFFPGACVPYAACVGPWWDERARRRPAAAPAGPGAPPEQDIWGTTGSPWGYVRRLPPPTPASQIQPRYRDASTIRPEFAEPAASAAAP